VDTTLILVAAIVGYFLGAISFARHISKMASPETDLTDIHIPIEGDQGEMRLRTIGATTASVKLGTKVGCVIGLLDMLKVAVPTLVFRLLYPEQPYFLFAAGMGVVGHNWPIYYRFKGGSGVSATYGGLLVIDWLGTLICSTAGMIFGMVIVKHLMVAYLAGLWYMIPWLWFRTHDYYHLGYIILVNVSFTLAVLPDIRLILSEFKKGNVDVLTPMEAFPMGKGMLKIMEFFKLKDRLETREREE
jgi:glycerol-3-phosphate acyltransferase PlsY